MINFGLGKKMYLSSLLTFVSASSEGFIDSRYSVFQWGVTLENAFTVSHPPSANKNCGELKKDYKGSDCCNPATKSATSTKKEANFLVGTWVDPVGLNMFGTIGGGMMQPPQHWWGQSYGDLHSNLASITEEQKAFQTRMCDGLNTITLHADGTLKVNWPSNGLTPKFRVYPRPGVYDEWNFTTADKNEYCSGPREPEASNNEGKWYLETVYDGKGKAVRQRVHLDGPFTGMPINSGTGGMMMDNSQYHHMFYNRLQDVNPKTNYDILFINETHMYLNQYKNWNYAIPKNFSEPESYTIPSQRSPAAMYFEVTRWMLKEDHYNALKEMYLL